MLEDNPYGLLRYEGEPLPTATPGRSDGGPEFVDLPGTFSKILSPGVRLGWAVAPRPVLEKLNLGKQGADLCSSSVSQYFVAAYFDAGAGTEYVRIVDRDLYRRRRDVMLDALEEHFPREAEWTQPAGRAVHLGDAARLHRHDRPAGPRRCDESVAFVPGRAAFIDGRGGSSMRLNFSGVGRATRSARGSAGSAR